LLIAVNEALHLPEEEQVTITLLLADSARESKAATDNFSQSIIIKQIELLLSYCDRFYNRQFLTRKQAGNKYLSDFEQLLEDYFNSPELGGVRFRVFRSLRTNSIFPPTT
jgi:AraC family transcriptional activator of pobA